MKTKYENNTLTFWGRMVWNTLSDQFKVDKSNNEIKSKLKVGKNFGASAAYEI